MLVLGLSRNGPRCPAPDPTRDLRTAPTGPQALLPSTRVRSASLGPGFRVALVRSSRAAFTALSFCCTTPATWPSMAFFCASSCSLNPLDVEVGGDLACAAISPRIAFSAYSRFLASRRSRARSPPAPPSLSRRSCFFESCQALAEVLLRCFFGPLAHAEQGLQTVVWEVGMSRQCSASRLSRRRTSSRCGRRCPGNCRARVDPA